MAITENAFTAEELQAAMTANPALLAVVKTHFSSEGTTLRTKEEEASFQANFEANVIARKTFEIASKLEADIKELTGLDKQTPDQKYFDYLKYAVTTKVGDLETLKSELDKLKANPASKPDDAARIKQLEDGIKAEQDKVVQLQAQHAEQLSNVQKEAIIDQHIATLKFKEGIPASMVDVYKKTVKDELIKTSKLADDGTLQVIDENSQVVVGADFRPKGVDLILKEKFADALDAEVVQPGAGTTAGTQGKVGGTQQPASGATELTVLPPNVKSRVQLTEHLYKMGITDDKPEFSKAFETVGKDLPLQAPA